MYKKFISAITWNSINVFVYKAILLLHQIILFYFISPELYGASGTLFAALYLLIGSTNFGFEYSLFTFFAHYVKNKKNFNQLICQSIIKFLATCTIALMVLKLCAAAPGATVPRVTRLFMYQLPISLIPYLVAIFVAESIRKYLETIAQLAFLNKKIAFIQVTMITVYVALVWSSYFIYKTISLNAIFIPMVIISCTEALWTLMILYPWYKKIPATSSAGQEDQINMKLMLKEQCFNYINQLSKNLFSPNFLMVLIAYQIGMQQTGKVRLFTNIISLLYMLLNRSVAIPSGALFSSINQDDFSKTKQIFLIITNIYIQFLYALAITITSTTSYSIILYQSESQIIYLVMLFILAGFIEYITITYEKLYIVQHKTHQLAIINVCSALVFITIIIQHPFSSSAFLLPMCCIRIVAASLIGLYAYKKWDIRPKLAISKYALYSGILLSSICNGIIYIKNLT